MAMIDYGCVVFKNGKQIHCGELFPTLKVGPYAFEFHKIWCKVYSSVGEIGGYWGANRWSDNHYGEPHRQPWRGKHARPVQYPDLVCREYGRVSVRDEYPAGLRIHIKSLDSKNARVFRFQTSFEGDRYTVYYGYGVDPDPKVWNRIKVLYLGKKLSAKLDRLIARSGGYASGEMFIEG